MKTGVNQKFTKRPFHIRANHHLNSIYISGWSIDPDVAQKYERVVSFITAHLSRADELTIYIKYQLFNTTTAKYLFDIIKLLNTYHAKGKQVEIHWDCGELMDEMLDTGFDLAQLCNFDFKITLL
jgi:hypothetical protein